MATVKVSTTKNGNRRTNRFEQPDALQKGAQVQRTRMAEQQKALEKQQKIQAKQAQRKISFHR